MSFNPVNFVEMPLGDNVPHEFNIVVEIPKDGTQKYEFDHELNVFRLDRSLYTSVHYPGDYGFLPKTLSEDGDPLDVIVKCDKPTFTGCIMTVRPIGVLRMIDKGANDYKILAVPVGDPRTAHTHDIDDLSSHFKDEIDHFFSVYKDLEGKESNTDGWGNKKEAINVIERAVERYKKNPL